MATHQKQLKMEPENYIPQHSFLLFGHEKQEHLFLSLLRSSKVPHAWIFSGPKGIGKSTFAFRVTRWLYGNKADSSYGIMGTQPESHINHKIMSASHNSFFYIANRKDKKTGKLKREIPVSEIRDLGRFLQKKPDNQQWKVVIIDAVDDLNLNAANALLKLLEESPEKSILILISHQYDSLLPTIKSRCIKLDFKPLNKQSLLKSRPVFFSSLNPQEYDEDLLLDLSKGSLETLDFLVEEGGYDLYQNLYSFFLELPHPDYYTMKTLTEKTSLSPKNQFFFQENCLNLIKKLANYPIDNIERIAYTERTLEKTSLLKTKENWINLWYEINTVFHEMNTIKLDTHYTIQAVLSILTNHH